MIKSITFSIVIVVGFISTSGSQSLVKDPKNRRYLNLTILILQDFDVRDPKVGQDSPVENPWSNALRTRIAKQCTLHWLPAGNQCVKALTECKMCDNMTLKCAISSVRKQKWFSEAKRTQRCKTNKDYDDNMNVD